MQPMEILLRAVRAGVRVRRRLRGPMRPTWSEDFETFALFMHHYAKQSVRLPIEWQRRAAEKVTSGSAAIARVECEKVDAYGVPAECFRSDDCQEQRVLLYLHGGGYCLCSIDTHRDLLARLCKASGMRVVAPEYRLAPEHPFPAQLEDALSVYRWLRDTGVDPARLVIAGESAGGGLTLSTLMSLRDKGEVLPAAAVCISPWLDLESTSASIDTNARYDYIHRRALAMFARRFAGRHNLRNPYAAPIWGDLRNLPPLLIHAGGAEALLDESLQLARRAREAGVAVELDVWADMIHAWHIFASFVPEGQQAVDQIAAFARRHTTPIAVAVPLRADQGRNA